MPRLAVRERRGQFFVSIGNLHNFCFASLVNLTKEIFPKPLDFLCRLWYTCIIKREERNQNDNRYHYHHYSVVLPVCSRYREKLHEPCGYVRR